MLKLRPAPQWLGTHTISHGQGVAVFRSILEQLGLVAFDGDVLSGGPQEGSLNW